MTKQQVREADKVLSSHRQLEGAGFVVRRPLPAPGLSALDPFLLIDEMGPVEYAHRAARVNGARAASSVRRCHTARVSKAFTKDDDAGEAPAFVSRRAPLPVDTPNYVTDRGLALLRAELAQELERAAGRELAGSDTERARAGAQHAARLADLEARLASAVLVEPALQPRDEVRFGARVRVRSASGAERSYRIVGVDEAEASSGAIAFMAPLARALLGKRVGDAALVTTPAGEDELEVLSIDYD